MVRIPEGSHSGSPWARLSSNRILYVPVGHLRSKHNAAQGSGPRAECNLVVFQWIPTFLYEPSELHLSVVTEPTANRRWRCRENAT